MKASPSDTGTSAKDIPPTIITELYICYYGTISHRVKPNRENTIIHDGEKNSGLEL